MFIDKEQLICETTFCILVFFFFFFVSIRDEVPQTELFMNY